MELREYLRILTKRLWLILPLTFLALVTSLWVSYQQTPIHEVTSTYVAKLDPSLSAAPGDIPIYGIDTLAGRQRIFVTYCEVMTSRSVREQAYALLPVAPDREKLEEDYEVLCSNLVETNVLSLSVQGPSSRVALQLNEAIGMVGVARNNTLYNSFPLENLDPPEVEEDLVAPQTTRNGIIGGLLGLVVGILAALMAEYLRSPVERMEDASIRNLQVGTYNERYFRQRFQQEINRPYARLRPMSLALLRLIPNEEFDLMPESVQTSMLRNVALTMQDALKQRSDIIGYLRQWTFGILLTETSEEEARTILEHLHNEIRSKTFEASGYVATFSANTGVIAGSGDSMEVHTALHQASEALEAADSRGTNVVHLVSTTPKPFVMGQDESDQDERNGASEGTVFNVSESDLFGDQEASRLSWQVEESDTEDDTSSGRSRRRNRLVKRSQNRETGESETSESERPTDE